MTETGTLRLKTGLAEMLKGGVILDVTDETQARIADPEIVERVMRAVSIPVMAKCRIGHFAEARVLEALGVDFIDESEVLTPADEEHHVDKQGFRVPFVCGCPLRDAGRRGRGPGPARR